MATRHMDTNETMKSLKEVFSRPQTKMAPGMKSLLFTGLERVSECSQDSKYHDDCSEVTGSLEREHGVQSAG